MKPQISFNFLGEIDAARATGFFTFAEESSGTAISPNRRRDYLLDLVGVVSGGRLLFSISFAPGQVAQARAEALLEHFRAELLTVNEHCRNKTEGEKTLSDFGDVDLSEDEFANILDILGS